MASQPPNQTDGPAPPPDPEPKPRVVLKKLTIHRFQNVKPGTVLTFDDDWNLLLGKNGSGKTTLLRLIEAILTGNLNELGPRPTHVEYELRAGSARITGEIKWSCGVWKQPDGPPLTGPEAPLLPFDLELHGRMTLEGCPEVTWSYRAPSSTYEVMVDGKPAPVHRATALFAYTAPFPLVVYFAAFEELNERIESWEAAARTGALQFARRFDEALDLFGLLLGWSTTTTRSGRSTFNPGIPWGVRFPNIMLGVKPESFGRIRADGLFSHSNDDDPVVAEFERLADLGEVTVELPLKRYDVTADDIIAELGPCRLRASLPSGSFFFHDDFSFGQKRLFAFLSYLAANGPIVLADELSNGMHRDWIDALVAKMRGRQNVIAAQNPLVIDRIGFRAAEQMQRSFILCREEDGHFVWENATSEDAHDVFRAYEVGIQNVSEILWQKGLW